jgi:uncharacterized protein involved in response to NO
VAFGIKNTAHRYIAVSGLGRSAVAVATFHAKAIFQLDGFATKSAPSLCGGRVAFEGARVNPAVEATPLERAATIAPRKVKIDPTAAAGGGENPLAYPLLRQYPQ